jgi:CubicO group peptidase (beta-lactamase class C family)
MLKSSPGVGILLWVGAGVLSPAIAQSSLDAAVESKIQDVEYNIATAVVIKGQHGSHVTLASRMAALHVPGISIAVIHNGKIEWARGFGVTKLGGPPVNADTLFQAGSISKPLTALGVLHLVQSGRLSLDADVNRYLRTWKVPDNEFTAQKKVTLRELLTHTAGVTVHGFPGYASGEPVPTLVQVLNGEKPANTPPIRVDTVPGTIWRYSGGGYVITQQLLLDVTRKSFPEFMRATVLGPLGMVHSTYEQPLPSLRRSEAATPYDQNGVPIVGGAHTYPEMAPAGLWTTPSDLARYAIEVQRSLVGESNRVLTKAMTIEMVKNGNLGDYGLGLEVGGGPSHPYFEHGGVDEGFVSNLVCFDSGDGAVIMTNGQNGGRLADEVLRTIAQEYDWPDFAPKEIEVIKVDPEMLDRYSGYYRRGRFTVVSIFRSDDHLTVKMGGRDLGEIYPTSDREWFFTNDPVPLGFVLGSNGNATGFVRRLPAFEMTASRIDASEAKQISDELAAKIKAQTQDPDSEAALRQNIDGLRDGKPDYGEMSPPLASVTKQELSDLQGTIKNLGTLQSISFKGVDPSGADIYDVAFEKGLTQWQILIGMDGKSETIGLRMLP